MNAKQLTARKFLGAQGDPRVIFTTGNVDSENDRLMQRELTFRPRMRVNVNHDVNKTVGMIKTVFPFQNHHEMTFRFFENDDYAAKIENLWKQDAFDASIAILPRNVRKNEFGGFDYGGEVLHVALTPQPANAECVPVLRSLGLWGRDTKAPTVLRVRTNTEEDSVLEIDDDETFLVDTEEVRRLTAQIVRDQLQTLIKDAVRKAVLRHTGRVD